MEHARLRGARALIKVARVLVKKGWENSSPDHDVDEAVGVFSSEALAVSLCPLHVIKTVACLVYASHSCGSEKDDGVGGGSERQFDF
jgi:hypothetical protein